METGFLLISGPDLYTSEREWRAIAGRNQALGHNQQPQHQSPQIQGPEPTRKKKTTMTTTTRKKKRLGRWRPSIIGTTGVGIETRRKASGRRRRRARSRGSATSSHSQGETSSGEIEGEGESEKGKEEGGDSRREKRTLAGGQEHSEAQDGSGRAQSVAQAAGTRMTRAVTGPLPSATTTTTTATTTAIATAEGSAGARGTPTGKAGAGPVGAGATPVHPANATVSSPSNNGRRATALGARPEPDRPAAKTTSNCVGRHGGASQAPVPGPGGLESLSRTGNSRGRVGAAAAAAPAGPASGNVNVSTSRVQGQGQAPTTSSNSLKSASAAPATVTTTLNSTTTSTHHENSKSSLSPLAWPGQPTASISPLPPFAAKNTQSSPGDNDCRSFHTRTRDREASATAITAPAAVSPTGFANPAASSLAIEPSPIAEPKFTLSTSGKPPCSPNILPHDSNAGFVASVGTAALAHSRAADPSSNDQASDKTPSATPTQSAPNIDSVDRKNHATARLQKRPRKLSLRINSHLQSAGLLSPTEKPLPVTPTSPLSKSLGDRPHHHDQAGQGAATITRPSSVLATRSENMSAPPPAARSGANLTTSNSNGAPVPGSSTEGSIAPSISSSHPISSKPFVIKNNRAFLPDPTMPYPLPVDLPEMHRQSLRTLLMFQLFNGPVTSPFLADNPPMRVLEVGCGSGFWSMMCHRYFSQHGHTNISFTGLDIVPMASFDSSFKPDKDMQWHFVQHDLRRFPWPFEDNTFDLVISKDLALCVSDAGQQEMIDETIRVMAPGGVLEVWEADHTIRMLRPHVPKMVGSNDPASSTPDGDESGSDEEDEATKLGAYVLTSNTPLSAPLNSFLVDYNSWVTKAFTQRGISPVPTTLVGPNFVQETDCLGDLCSKRMAIPLSEIRWEREGVGGVVTKDGKSYIDTTKGKGRVSESKRNKAGGKVLTPAQAALRRTALETVVDQILSLETVLREVTRKSQDEWDGWCGKMMNDLLNEGGTSWGECLEVGAWSARKKFPADK